MIMKEETRKYLGWGLLAFATATLLILPWLAIDFVVTKYKEHKEIQKQAETAKVLALHYFNSDPYVEIFKSDDGDLAAEERGKIYKHMTDFEPQPPQFIADFYNRVIGRKEESPARVMLREAYESKSAPTKMLTDIYNLLKNSIGRKLFEKAHQAVDNYRKIGPSKTVENSLSKMSKLNGRKRLRRSNSDELRRTALINSNPVGFEEVNMDILRNTFSGVKDIWRGEKSVVVTKKFKV